jgi:hypothetical protein
MRTSPDEQKLVLLTALGAVECYFVRGRGEGE